MQSLTTVRKQGYLKTDAGQAKLGQVQDCKPNLLTGAHTSAALNGSQPCRAPRAHGLALQSEVMFCSRRHGSSEHIHYGAGRQVDQAEGLLESGLHPYPATIGHAQRGGGGGRL
eukprot:1019641-Pyramimonas_sp.AAC.1